MVGDGFGVLGGEPKSYTGPDQGEHGHDVRGGGDGGWLESISFLGFVHHSSE